MSRSDSPSPDRPRERSGSRASLPAHDASGEAGVPFLSITAWAERFPWLLAGITLPGEQEEPFDLALFGERASEATSARWSALLRATGFPAAAHARQVHETRVAVHDRLPPGLHVEPDSADGHVTSTPGVLLAVTVADCVPVYLVDPERRAVALLHAGWRGTAAGILARGVDVLCERATADPGALHAHLGPAICGDCYEVGPEVFEALGLDAPAESTPVEVRRVLAAQAVTAGVRPDRVSVSEHCTLCGSTRFFSHRGGRAERQAGVLGIRP